MGNSSASRPNLELGIVVRLQRVWLSYGGLPDEKAAVRDLDFVVSEGESVGLKGPNGAGKTTVARLLSGTVRPDKGIQSLPRTSFVLSGLLRPGGLGSAEREWLMLVARAGLRTKDIDWQALDQEEPELQPSRYRDAGWRAQLRLAGLLSLRRRGGLVISDEVLTPADRHWIRAYRSAAATHGSALLVISHDDHVLRTACDRVVRIVRGRVVGEESTDRLSVDGRRKARVGRSIQLVDCSTAALERPAVLRLQDAGLRLKLQRQSKRERSNWVFRNVSASWSPGSVGTVRGPGSSVKYLLRAIADAVSLTEGLLIREGTGVLVTRQTPGPSGMTVLDAIRQLPPIHQERAEVMVSTHVSSSWSQDVSTLSTGQKIRLSMSLAFAQQPRLYVIDAPLRHGDKEFMTWFEFETNRELRNGAVVIGVGNNWEVSGNPSPPLRIKEWQQL